MTEEKSNLNLISFEEWWAKFTLREVEMDGASLEILKHVSEEAWDASRRQASKVIATILETLKDNNWEKCGDVVKDYVQHIPGESS